MGTEPQRIDVGGLVTSTQPRKRVRVRAPELTGTRWLNTGGKSYSIKDFRGKILLLDYLTFCCVNCIHVLGSGSRSITQNSF